MIPFVIIVAATLVFFVLERVLPGVSFRKRGDGMSVQLSSIFVRSVLFCWQGSRGIAGYNHGPSFTFQARCHLFCKGLLGGLSVRSYSIGGTGHGTSPNSSGEFAIKSITAQHGLNS